MRAILTSFSDSIFSSSVFLGCRPHTFTCRILNLSVAEVVVFFPVANLSTSARVGTDRRGPCLRRRRPSSIGISLRCAGIEVWGDSVVAFFKLPEQFGALGSPTSAKQTL